MATVALTESLESKGISRAFYTGGHVLVGQISGFIYSLYDGGVSIVDPATGETYARINLEDDPVLAFAVNPTNNDEVITVGKSNLCRHWLVSSAHEVTQLRAWSSGHIHPTLSIDISHDGSLVATASVDRTIRVFALPGYYSICVYRVTMQDPMSIIRFLPRFHALATLGTDNSIAIWDLDQPSLQTPWRELKGHMSTIHSISFSPDGTTMMSTGNDQMVISWDVSDLHTISMLSQLAVFESVKSVLALSKTACVTGGDKGRIRIWKDRKCVCDIPSGHAAEGHLNFLYSLPKTGELLSVGADLGMSIWTKPSGMKTEFSRQLMGNMGELLSMKWLPGGDRVVVAVNDEFPRIIDTRNFSAVSKMVGHSDIVLCVAVGRDLIATGSKDQTVRVWDLNTLECVSEMLGHTGPVNAVAFTRREDGEGVRVISGSEDNSIKIWRAVNKKSSSKKLIIRSIMAHSKPVNAVVVSKNDKWVATGSQDRSAKIFNIDDGSLVATCTGHKGSIWGVDFSPIEQILATCSRDGTVKLWNLAAPGAPCIRTFEGHEQSVMACRFLCNGLQLISADSLGTMRLWNVRTGECPLIALVDGETIATSSEKRKDAKAAETKALEDFAESETTAKIWTIDITQEEGGKLKVVSGTNNGTMNVWTDNTEELVEARRKQISDNAEKDTSIQVLMKAGKYADAFRNAFALNRPKLMLEVVREALWREDKTGRVNVGRFVTENVTDEKSAQRLMHIAQDWQKTAKTCAVAYQLVEAAVRHASTLIPETAIDVSKFEGFAEKHLARLTSLSQKCYIIDAILLASNAANIEQN